MTSSHREGASEGRVRITAFDSPRQRGNYDRSTRRFLFRRQFHARA
jgi:hypothetical protein